MEKIRFNRLKVVLAEKDIKSKEIAQHLGVTGVTISRWINNEFQPTPENFHKLADYLDVDVRMLIVSTKKL